LADFEDSSAGHTEVHTPTPNAGATIDTVIYKYGNGSGLFYNGNVTFPDSVDFEFGADPFTISCWVYNPNTAKFWIHHQTTTANRLTLGIPYGNVIQFIGVTGNVLVVHITAGIGTLTGWHHFEVSRNGSSGYIFIDGIKQTLTKNIYSGTMATPTDVFNIGLLQYANDYSSGNFDCLKIDKGICRHTANFTPPANEDVDNDAYTVLLLKMNTIFTKINIGNSWKEGTPYINIADTWKTALKVYISLHGNATWESVKNMTWNDLLAETWDYEKQSWRTVI